ncbi:peptidyl-prolyl cis-trans isomerase FKBP65-like [Spinacia oleracea]|uniref:Peptidyl-prolyl cis-trans isomerase FKBP65-like n=1 Tax=Spinacia oleracea TaxID=3562 RepID=A0ABM3R3N2_SPIOL|nr:peptidyl-prolyl cis-trans isomerase FKBP65-like [Spinacia oleracea]
MLFLGGYEKFRGEVNKLLIEGDNLKEEDEILISLILESEIPREVLDLAKGPKEEGNLLFKSGSIKDALEKYGYAGLILARYIFYLEEDRIKFFELANCILLNLAACFNKRKEFELVGYIFSIILEYNPNNVKALFRRASASIELGRCDFAYWDLSTTKEIDPTNGEISKKLGQVQPFVIKKVQKSRSPGGIPVGLGIDLSSPKKK